MAKTEQNKLLDFIFKDNIEGMREYLNAGGNPNFIINREQTPIGLAKSVEMAQLLLDKGADIHTTNYRGLTPFLWQSLKLQPEIIKLLLDKDPSIISDRDVNGYTALHFCATQGENESLECAKILLSHKPKIDINAKDNGGQTALDAAVMSDNVETENIIRLLIDKGANTTLSTIAKRSNYARFVNDYVEHRKWQKEQTNRITHDQAYRGLANKGLPENVVGVNIKGFVEGAVAPGQGRPEYPARGSRKSRKARKSRKGKSKRKN